MMETMEQYMSKTRGNYGSGVVRPKINDKTHFELKGKYLKELRENTFNGSEHEDANEHIEKVLEIVDLFHIPEVIQDQYCPPARTTKKMEEINNFQQEPDESLFRALERFKELLMKCPQHYLTDMQKVILFYNGLDVPTRQILDSKGTIPTKTAADRGVSRDVLHTPYRDHSTEACFLKLFPSQGDYKTIAVTIKERHRCEDSGSL
ncbi:hypothetical protein Tco_1414571 [Tanacetum coccineum]